MRINVPAKEIPDGLNPGDEFHVAKHPTEEINGYWRIIGQDPHTKLVQIFKAGGPDATEEERGSWMDRLEEPQLPLLPKVKMRGSGRMEYPDGEVGTKD